MLFIFDKDGTICRAISGDKFINSVDDQELIPGVLEVCERLREEGHTLAVASNQGGVAFGIMTAEQAQEIVGHAADLIGAEAWAVSLTHPAGRITEYAVETDYRKPGPGMLNDLRKRLGFDVADTRMIGDRPEDIQAAAAAEVKFSWTKDFFFFEKKVNK